MKLLTRHNAALFFFVLLSALCRWYRLLNKNIFYGVSFMT